MLPARDVQHSMAGAWRMMMGKADGLKMLDISADGFWDSFFAIVVGLPAMILGWVSSADALVDVTDAADGRFSIMLRLAAVDIAVWIVPLAALALAARPIGVADRYVHYVVASNWVSAWLVWIMLPPAVVRLFAPDAGDVIATLWLVTLAISLVLSWRMTNIAIGKGPGLATGVFVGMVLASLLVLFGMEELLGLG